MVLQVQGVSFRLRTLPAVILGFIASVFNAIVSLFASLAFSLFTRAVPVRLTYNDAANPLVSAKEGKTTLTNMIRTRCPSLYGPKAVYKPTWWLPGGNIQTVWCVVGELIERKEIPYERHFLRTVDGGTLSLDVYPPFESREDDTPILFILHGLTGTSQESYIRDTVREVTKSKVETGKGFRCVALNFRGCDVDTPVTSQRLYHAGETDDTRTCLLWLQHTYPNAPLYGAGFSMGACTLATYLGEEGTNTPLKATVNVSNPWSWITATEYIEHGGWLQRYIYGPILADALLTVFKNSRYAFESDKRLNIKDIYSKRYVFIRWYDDRVTSKLFGFRDADDYYDQASSDRFLPLIRTPHLSLHSLDDPMVAAHNLNPIYKAAAYESDGNVVMATTRKGGHVAWFTGGGFKRWFTTPIREWLEAVQSVDPSPRPALKTLAPPSSDPKMIRAAQWPDRVGFAPLSAQDAASLMTARVYSRGAHAPVMGS